MAIPKNGILKQEKEKRKPGKSPNMQFLHLLLLFHILLVPEYSIIIQIKTAANSFNY